VGESFKAKHYRAPLDSVVFAELVMGLYCSFGVFLYLKNYHFMVGPFLVIYTLGFSYVAILSFLHSRVRPGGLKDTEDVFWDKNKEGI
jgi:hypothetical protein